MDFGGSLFSWFTPSTSFIEGPDLDSRMRSNVEKHFQVPSCEQLIVDTDNKMVVTAADFKRVLQSQNPILRICRQGKPQYSVLPPPIVEGASPLSQSTIAPFSPSQDRLFSVLRPTSSSSPYSPVSVGTQMATVYSPSTTPPMPVSATQSMAQPVQGVTLGSYSPSHYTRPIAEGSPVADSVFNALDRNGVTSRQEVDQRTRVRTPSVSDVTMRTQDYNAGLQIPTMAVGYNTGMPMSTATLTRASTPPRVNFSVTLRKEMGSHFGIELDSTSDQRALVVQRVLLGGALAAWNAQNWQTAVRQGDVISAVNQVMTDATRMESELRNSKTVRLDISGRGAQSV